jgi:ADP-ribosylglycohydrolase
VKGLLGEEFTQSREEGRDPAVLDRLKAEFATAGNDEAALEALQAKLLRVPLRPDFPFDEPTDLAAIRARRPTHARRPAPKLSDPELLDRLHGAWLGRCVGCALGKPVEGFMGAHNGLASWERQKRYLTAISPDEWPIRDYVPEHSPAENETGKVGCPASTRDHITFMESDDDIRYTVLGQVVLDRYGRDFASAHVAHVWFDRLPYNQVCTAETQAYRNMVIRFDEFRGWLTPERAAELDRTVDWTWITHHLNPYREWIGAQIRVDSYGYACPGNPELAAEMAWRDARISHVKNGVYGAMLCAAMIAEAFVTKDPLAIVEAGLAEIPASSRLYSEMRDIIALCAQYGNDFAHFETVIQEIYRRLGHYNAVHTNNNAALCVAAVLLSSGDFAKGITFAVMGGWDTDCNGATVGSIVGALTGAKAAPAHWTARLHDTLNSLIPDYHPVAISECARRSLAIARKVAG